MAFDLLDVLIWLTFGRTVRPISWLASSRPRPIAAAVTFVCSFGLHTALTQQHTPCASIGVPFFSRTNPVRIYIQERCINCDIIAFSFHHLSDPCEAEILMCGRWSVDTQGPQEGDIRPGPVTSSSSIGAKAATPCGPSSDNPTIS